MEWSNIKKVINMELSKKSGKVTAPQKRQHIKTVGSICYYCGGTYMKYLYCTASKDNTEITLSCKLCYMLTHLDYYLHDKEVMLMYSKLSQLAIIRKTVDTIIEHGYVPYCTEIDKDVRLTKLTFLEYLSCKDILQDNNYKVFFTDKLDNNFVSSLIPDDDYIFDTDDNVDDDTNLDDKDSETLAYHELTKQQVANINAKFSTDNSATNMDHMMNTVLYNYRISRDQIATTTLEYQLLMIKIDK